MTFTHDLIISQGYAPRGRGIIPEKIQQVRIKTLKKFQVIIDYNS
jgi:hypothetical protein